MKIEASCINHIIFFSYSKESLELKIEGWPYPKGIIKLPVTLSGRNNHYQGASVLGSNWVWCLAFNYTQCTLIFCHLEALMHHRREFSGFKLGFSKVTAEV